MALLDRLLDTVVQGHGCLAIITGEAGVGKSRLVREFTSVATEEHGFDTFVGVCRELDRDSPFAPFADALRQRLTEAGVDARDLLGPNSEALALLLPELQRFSGPALPPLSPEQEKRRCFEAVAALLRRLAVRQPLLVVLEDLHWADATTLELLEVLPRRLASTSVLLLLTARSDEPETAFEHCLAKLRRERLADLEVALDPLDQEEVGRMLAAMLPTPPSSSAIAVIHARTDGNPFFVEEIVATAPADSTFTWLASEAVVPRTVREAVLRRLEGLGQATQAVVNLAAVIGQRVDLDLLVAVSDLQQEEVLRTLETLVERHILVERPLPGAHLGGFSFRHALTRDAIYNRLLLVRRRALHRQVAEMLEAASQAAATPGGAADIGHSDLGYHFHAAQQWDKALTYAASAGDAARRLHATNEALVHYQRALDAAQALGSPRTAELDRHCGQCFALLGGFDAARQHLEAALQAARRNGDTALEQGVLYDLAGLYASCDYLQGKEYAQEALAKALAAQDPRLEALALNRLGNIYSNLLQMADARALHEDALQRFHALDDRWGVADCLDLIGMARYLSGEVAEARAAFAQAAAVFLELDDAERVASSVTSRGLYLAVLDGPCSTDAGPLGCRPDVEQGLRLCRDLGWRAGETYALVAVACLDLAEGKYRDALRNAESALTIAREIDHQQWQVISLLTLGLIAADFLDHRRALANFESALTIAQAVGSAQWIERLEAWVACCHGRLGDHRSADSMLATVLPSGPQPTTIGQRRALCTLAEIELARDNPKEALQLLERLLAGASGPRPAPLLLLRAKALMVLGRREEADDTLLEARRLAEEFGPRSVLWQVAASRAQLWRASSPSISTEETRLASAEVSALANAIRESESQQAFRRAPEVRPWAGRTGRQRTAAAASAPGGLTPRERDVVVCIAQGMSNKETARHLYIAEKTVEMHVSSSLGKLGFSSRVQLAAWAVAEGLVPAPQGHGSS